MPTTASQLAKRIAGAALALCVGSGTATMIGCHSMQTSNEVACQANSAACSTDCDDDCNQHCLMPPMERYLRCLDERVTISNATRRADEAMRYDYNSRPSDDVIYGYQEAFIDVALGASGEVPPVPPQRYWGTCYRTADGHARAQDWFAGYTAGASRALATCRHQFNKVSSSGRSPYETDPAPSTVQEAPGHADGLSPNW